MADDKEHTQEFTKGEDLLLERNKHIIIAQAEKYS